MAYVILEDGRLFGGVSLYYDESLLDFMCMGTAECTSIDAFKHAGENIVFASGSPFENVDLGN